MDFHRALGTTDWGEFEYIRPYVPAEGIPGLATMCTPCETGDCRTQIKCADKPRAPGTTSGDGRAIDTVIGEMDERSMLLFVCHHGFVLRGTALVSTTHERFDMYDVALAGLARWRNLGDVHIDFACQYGVHLRRRVEALVERDQNSFADLRDQLAQASDADCGGARLMVPYMHGSSHGYSCKHKHWAVYKSDSCRRAGETTEHVWSRLRSSFTGRLRLMSSMRRSLLLEHIIRGLDSERKKEFPLSFANTAHRLLRRDGVFDNDVKLYYDVLQLRSRQSGVGIRELHATARRFLELARANPDCASEPPEPIEGRVAWLSHEYHFERYEDKKMKMCLQIRKLQSQHRLGESGPWSRNNEEYLPGIEAHWRFESARHRASLVDAWLDRCEIRRQLRDRSMRDSEYTELKSREITLSTHVSVDMKNYNYAVEQLNVARRCMNMPAEVDPAFQPLTEQIVDAWDETSPENDPFTGVNGLARVELTEADGTTTTVRLSLASLRRLAHLGAYVARDAEDVNRLREEADRALSFYARVEREESSELESSRARALGVKRAILDGGGGDDGDLQDALWAAIYAARAAEVKRDAAAARLERLGERLRLDKFDDKLRKAAATFARFEAHLSLTD